MSLKTTRAETEARLIALGVCPNHPAHPLAPGKKVCYECYDLSKADTYEWSHYDEEAER